MDWLQILTLIIEAVSALATVAAVLVALYQTKYVDRIRLKFHYNYETSREIRLTEPYDHVNVKCINIEIIILSSREVVFDYIKIYANRQYYCNLNNGYSLITCNIHDEELGSNRKRNIKVYLPDAKKKLDKIDKNIKLKKKLIFIIKTSSNKTLKIKTSLKNKELLEMDYSELVQKCL